MSREKCRPYGNIEFFLSFLGAKIKRETNIYKSLHANKTKTNQLFRRIILPETET